MALPSVLIVGAGATGSLLAAMLKDAGIRPSILEKSRGAGGRMSTYEFRREREGAVLARADMGAQYLTSRCPVDHSVLGPIYGSLLGAGVLRAFEGEVAGPNPYGAAGADIRHFTAPKGLQSVVEHFVEGSGVEVKYGTSVSTIDLESHGALRVGVDLGEGASAVQESLSPAIVVLTQPVSQSLGRSKFAIGGNFMKNVDQSLTESLSKVEYSSRFAAAFFFETSSFRWPHTWTAKYLDKGDVRYVAHDSGKRMAHEESLISVLVHSSVPLGIELQDEEAPFERARERILTALEGQLPDIPWRSASSVKVHKWKYSQVYKGIGARRPAADWVWDSGDGGFPGSVELVRTDNALVLLAGDSLAPASNFEGCVFSARRAADSIVEWLRATGRLPGQARSDL